MIVAIVIQFLMANNSCCQLFILQNYYKQLMQVENSNISSISVQSKRNSQHSKYSPSTQTPESPELKSFQSNQFRTCEGTWEQEHATMRFQQLQKEIARAEKEQQEMQRKFKKCIEQMIKQIEKNNENNNRLAQEVNYLRQEVNQSKKDIQIIDEYMKNTIKREGRVRLVCDGRNESKLKSSRDLLGSCSGSKNFLSRRSQGKLLKSHLSIKL